MKKALAIFILLMVLFISNTFLSVNFNAKAISTDSTEVKVINPDTGDGNFIFDSTSATVGTKFNATVWVYEVTDLYAHQIYFVVNDDFLNITNAWLPTWDSQYIFYDLPTVRPTPAFYDEDEDGVYESVMIGDCLLGLGSAEGSGLLAIIELEIIYTPEVGEVTTDLNIDNSKTYLIDSALSEVPAVKTNGFYKFTGAPPTHDIAISRVEAYPESVFVGESIQLTIDVTNHGSEDEVFTLEIYYDEILIYSEQYSIAGKSTRTITYTWDTTGVAPGTYTLMVEAMLPEDVKPEDNVFTGPTITIMPLVKQPPVALFDFTPEFPIVGETVTFNASESYDPDGGKIIEYLWDFGDNYTGTGMVVTHSYEFEGTYYVTLTVIDDDEQSSTSTQPITVVTIMPVGGFEIVMEPWCTNGTYPEWKEVTIYNLGEGCITKIDITHPLGYKLGKIITPTGWKVNYDSEARLITLEAMYPSAGIPGGENRIFRILFDDGPRDQGIYVFSVTVSDPATGYHERKDVYQYIDTTVPEVSIVTPANGAVIKKGGFWVNVTASDEGLCPCCGIDRVELYINGEFWGVMNYDGKNDVYYMWIESLPHSETYYNIVAKAYDKAGNIAYSRVTIFWVGVEPEIEIYNKVIYDNYGEKKAYGHVESEVYVRGVTGFTPNAEIEIYFEDDLIKRIRADKYGRFLTTITIPEVPRGTYTIKAVEVECPNNQDSTTVTVYPWMFNNGEGYAGDTFTVKGKGFAANVEVLVYYRDVAKCSIHWDEWATEWWNETDYMEWNPVLDEVIVARVWTDQKGSFTATFTIPESYGGLHPIYGREKVSGVRSGYPTDTLWKGRRLDQCVTFHVKTNIWVTPDTGVSGQYVTLHATGLPAPCGYTLKINDKYVYCNRQWSIALDFGPHKYWVWEHNFVMNNEVDVGWLAGVRVPIYYYSAFKCSKVWNGTLCWADIDGVLHEGSPFLKIPNLVNGEYMIKLYFFNEETLQDVYDYADQEVFVIIKDPLEVKVEVGSLHYPEEIVTVIIKTSVDGRTADVSDMTVKMFHEGELVSTLDWSKIDVGLYQVTFKCPSEQGTYFIIVSANKEYELFTLYAEGTAEFTVSQALDLSDINAMLVEIKSGIASIDSAIGTLNFELEDLEARIVDIDGLLVTIDTKIGGITANLTDIANGIIEVNGTTARIETLLGVVETEIDTIIDKVEVVDGKIDEVVIKTYLGQITGKIVSIDEEIATISTNIGTLKTKVEKINGLEQNISGYSGMQTFSIAFSMIAAFAAIIVVAIVLRRGYKK